MYNLIHVLEATYDGTIPKQKLRPLIRKLENQQKLTSKIKTKTISLLDKSMADDSKWTEWVRETLKFLDSFNAEFDIINELEGCTHG
jgi:hypothetical protein